MQHVLDAEPLLELLYDTLFCHRYGYSVPKERHILEALKKAGIADPLAAMEAWRKERDILTDLELATELHERGEGDE